MSVSSKAAMAVVFHWSMFQRPDRRPAELGDIGRDRLTTPPDRQRMGGRPSRRDGDRTLGLRLEVLARSSPDWARFILEFQNPSAR